MGHSEMLLAVAGLNELEIKRRTEKLSSGDWSDLPPAERLAYRFAYQVSREPAAISDADIRELVGAFGPERATDLIWYGAWCNYMTRVADAFQLPLEKENVFARPGITKPADNAKDRR
jgi:alkylhydroperoxidase family enzyme